MSVNEARQSSDKPLRKKQQKGGTPRNENITRTRSNDEETRDTSRRDEDEDYDKPQSADSADSGINSVGRDESMDTNHIANKKCNNMDDENRSPRHPSKKGRKNDAHRNGDVSKNMEGEPTDERDEEPITHRRMNKSDSRTNFEELQARQNNNRERINGSRDFSQHESDGNSRKNGQQNNQRNKGNESDGRRSPTTRYSTEEVEPPSLNKFQSRAEEAVARKAAGKMRKGKRGSGKDKADENDDRIAPPGGVRLEGREHPHLTRMVSGASKR